MKEIILKWIEMLKEKHKLQYAKCSHEWEEHQIESRSVRVFICSKCGEFKQIEIK